MKSHYPHLSSPLSIRGVALKNRLLSTNSLPHFLQGPEPYPSAAVMKHLANRAKNGAAIITMTGLSARYGLKEMPPPPGGAGGDIPHFPRYDIYDPKCQNYFAQLADSIHYYGSIVSMSLQRPIVLEYGVNDDAARGINAYTPDIIDEMINSYVDQALVCKSFGFDMVSVHFAYESPFVAQFLSPLYNHRTDEYGGSLENRSKVVCELFRRLRESLGEDFLVEAIFSAHEREGGLTLGDTGKVLKLLEGLVDIAQVRNFDGNSSHPTGFMTEKTPTLEFAAYFRGLNIPGLFIAPVGGFQDVASADAAIAEGKADLIAAARAFICDPEYGRKIAEGRGRDVAPCIRCNKCHVLSQSIPYLSACSVNPLLGIEHVVDQMVTKPARFKNIAVIGGGPAGMQTALLLAERRHRVTLYEKGAALGGQLIPACAPDFKWPLRDYLDHLIRRVEASDVTVLLNGEAAPEEIERLDFDAVVAATGAAPNLPPIPGLDGGNVVTAVDALNDPSLAKERVVVIGGGEIGAETGLFLARLGRNVTILEMTDRIAPESDRPHYYEVLIEEIEKEPNLSILPNARVTEVVADGNGVEVRFLKNGADRSSAPADTVVVALGSKSRSDEALSFFGTAPETFYIGDCRRVGSLTNVCREAFATASNL
jgi:2,4-dienoyl-CoA reductase-like NADH-dependent reductase (Old Yellow Enzyme family)/thioredoxin reductase